MSTLHTTVQCVSWRGEGNIRQRLYRSLKRKPGLQQIQWASTPTYRANAHCRYVVFLLLQAIVGEHLIREIHERALDAQEDHASFVPGWRHIDGVAASRTCSADLALALAGNVLLYRADLFEFDLIDGSTSYYFTSWDSDLTVGSQVYSSRSPFIESARNGTISNKMQVPSHEDNAFRSQ